MEIGHSSDFSSSLLIASMTSLDVPFINYFANGGRRRTSFSSTYLVTTALRQTDIA